jgi:hypothetical protein
MSCPVYSPKRTWSAANQGVYKHKSPGLLAPRPEWPMVGRAKNRLACELLLAKPKRFPRWPIPPGAPIRFAQKNSSLTFPLTFAARITRWSQDRLCRFRQVGSHS